MNLIQNHQNINKNNSILWFINLGLLITTWVIAISFLATLNEVLLYINLALVFVSLIYLATNGLYGEVTKREKKFFWKLWFVIIAISLFLWVAMAIVFSTGTIINNYSLWVWMFFLVELLSIIPIVWLLSRNGFLLNTIGKNFINSIPEEYANYDKASLEAYKISKIKKFYKKLNAKLLIVIAIIIIALIITALIVSLI